MSRKHSGLGILIVFNTPYLYGMERSVIETFDLVRPEVTPHFLMSYTTYQENLPLLAEVKRRRLSYSFFRDKKGWPNLQKPTSFRHFWRLLFALISGNLSVLKASISNDVLYIPSIRYFYFAFFAALYYRLAGKRIIYHFHDLVRGRSKQLRFVSFFITDFVHNTQLGYGEVTAANPWLSGKKYWIIPLTVHSSLQDAVSANGEQKFGDGRHILFVGQVGKHKGVDLLLDAFEKVSKAQHQDVTLHLLGGCSDPVLRQRVDQSCKDAANVKYWGYRTDVGEFLKHVDLLVQPSRVATHESFGRSVVEAMATGVPCVAFRSGALQELIIHEETGLICEQENAECLADNINRLLENNLLRARCGAMAKTRYEEMYSQLRVKSMWLRLIKESAFSERS
jgi:glycosyltransferase involved in cell wall biosynthesis